MSVIFKGITKKQSLSHTEFQELLTDLENENTGLQCYRKIMVIRFGMIEDVTVNLSNLNEKLLKQQQSVVQYI